jgi:hypothetical protein
VVGKPQNSREIDSIITSSLRNAIVAEAPSHAGGYLAERYANAEERKTNCFLKNGSGFTNSRSARKQCHCQDEIRAND